LVGKAEAPGGIAGAGEGAAQLLSKVSEMLIQGGQKVVATYERVDVTSGGIFAGGMAFPSPRTPSVRIVGATQMVADPNTTGTRTYSIDPVDLRPLGVSWTAEGTIANPGGESTAIQFNIPEAEPGTVLPKHAAVRVTDSDNLIAEAAVDVNIHIKLPEEPADVPPICQIKPWLPQCQEPLAHALERRRQSKR
jgi:hypothetical protein